jgi:hypothetical protein
MLNQPLVLITCLVLGPILSFGRLSLDVLLLLSAGST